MSKLSKSRMKIKALNAKLFFSEFMNRQYIITIEGLRERLGIVKQAKITQMKGHENHDYDVIMKAIKATETPLGIISSGALRNYAEKLKLVIVGVNETKGADLEKSIQEFISGFEYLKNKCQ